MSEQNKRLTRRVVDEDGKVIEHWSVRDDLSQALQLGLIGDEHGRATLRS
jgi:hypothetical protein